MKAIAVEVIFMPGLPADSIECKAFNHSIRHLLRQPALPCNNAQAIKGRFAGSCSVQSLGRQFTDRLQPGRRIDNRLHLSAMILPVGHIVAFATPGVEQPDTFSCGPVEQLAGCGKGY